MNLSPHAAIAAALLGVFALASSPASAALIPAGRSFAVVPLLSVAPTSDMRWDSTDFYAFGCPSVGVAGTIHLTDPAAVPTSRSSRLAA
jgi:hypothetical protein